MNIENGLYTLKIRIYMGLEKYVRKEVEVRGIEPRSETVYRSSIYMLSYRIEVRLQRRSVTHNCRLFCMDFARHLTEGKMPYYPVISTLQRD